MSKRVPAAIRVALLCAAETMETAARYEAAPLARASIKEAAAAFTGLANGESFDVRGVCGLYLHNTGATGRAVCRAVSAHYMRPDLMAAALHEATETRPRVHKEAARRIDSLFNRNALAFA